MIEYTTDANQLCSVFTQYRNTINIYTEDEQKDKKFYKTLFSRLLYNTGILINDVTPLGSCGKVIDACGRDIDSHPKIYIVDGDIHLMTSQKKEQSHLYVLDRYCIENFLIDKNSYYKVFDELDSEHEEETIKQLVDYDNMMNDVINPMMELFCHFAVSQDVLGAFRIKHVTQIMKKGMIDSVMLNNEKASVKNNVISQSGITSEMFNQLLLKKQTLYTSTSENLQKYVSGKNYLMPYVIEYTKKKLKQNIGITKEGWKYHFSKYCQLEPLEGLKEAIIQEVLSASSTE